MTTPLPRGTPLRQPTRTVGQFRPRRESSERLARFLSCESSFLTRPRRAGTSARIRLVSAARRRSTQQGPGGLVLRRGGSERVEQLEKLARPGGVRGDGARDRIGAVAQSTRGSVAGTVRDGQGAAVPGATVELTSPRRNDTQVTTANEAGDFVFLNLLPDTYNLKVTMDSFKTVEQSNVVLNAADRLSLGVDHPRARRGVGDGQRQHPRRRSPVARRHPQLLGRLGGHREPRRQRPRPAGPGAPRARHRRRHRRRHRHERERRPRQHDELHRRRRQQPRHRQQRRPRLDQPRRGRGVRDPHQRLLGRVLAARRARRSRS